jgi:NADPH:quinone reductase
VQSARRKIELMKAVRYHRKGGPEVLVLEDLPRPVPLAGEVLVKVEAAGVNFADTMRRSGDSYPLPTPLPFVPGGEAVGTIAEGGDSELARLVGTRVFAYPTQGCYAQYVIATQEQIQPLPATLDSVQGVALFIQGLTAAFALRDAARLLPGETVLIEGAAGGVGVFAVQMAKIFAAGKVIGAAGSEAKRALVRGLGADLAVDYTQAGWSKTVLAATGGRGADVILSMTGGEVFNESMASLAPFGRLIVYGAASGKRAQVDTEQLTPGNRSIIGFYLRPFLPRRDYVAATLEELAALIAQGRLRVQVHRALPLARAEQAHRLLESRQTLGKLVLLPWKDK